MEPGAAQDCGLWTSTLSFAFTVGILGFLILISAYLFLKIHFRLNHLLHDPRNRIFEVLEAPRVAEPYLQQSGESPARSLAGGKSNRKKAVNVSSIEVRGEDSEGSKYESKEDCSEVEDHYSDWQVNWAEVELKTLIGSGRFGEIYKGRWCGTEVAVKMPQHGPHINRRVMEAFKREVRIMSRLHHPNIVLFLGGSLEPTNMFLLMEYCHRGNLFNFIQRPSGAEKLGPQLVHKFTTDIARGMKYLHSRAGIIQRDLKSSNLLVDQNYNIKIGDFGMSKYDTNSDYSSKLRNATPFWTAPEIIRNEKYDVKADVYSFGIVMWELMAKRMPYENRSGPEVMYAVAKGERPEILATWPSYYVDLMKRCWQDDPMLRPSFTEILEELFDKYHQDRNLRRAALP
mmetsp:Transcript_10610/g.13351  ORF Transcript_10610/g.13351 Transcript_10610/m.13351 type:complete len:400 (-) Transcript_10610:162-1361(-)